MSKYGLDSSVSVYVPEGSSYEDRNEPFDSIKGREKRQRIS
jgi:hypothetical protein